MRSFDTCFWYYWKDGDFNAMRCRKVFWQFLSLPLFNCQQHHVRNSIAVEWTKCVSRIELLSNICSSETSKASRATLSLLFDAAFTQKLILWCNDISFTSMCMVYYESTSGWECFWMPKSYITRERTVFEKVSFTFRVGKSLLKMPKMVHFAEF